MGSSLRSGLPAAPVHFAHALVLACILGSIDSYTIGVIKLLVTGYCNNNAREKDRRCRTQPDRAISPQ